MHNHLCKLNTLQAWVGFYPSLRSRWTHWTSGSFKNGEAVEVKDLCCEQQPVNIRIKILKCTVVAKSHGFDHFNIFNLITLTIIIDFYKFHLTHYAFKPVQLIIYIYIYLHNMIPYYSGHQRFSLPVPWQGKR